MATDQVGLKIYVNKTLARRLRRHAKRNAQPVAAVVRLAVSAYLNEHEPTKGEQS